MPCVRPGFEARLGRNPCGKDLLTFNLVIVSKTKPGSGRARVTQSAVLFEVETHGFRRNDRGDYPTAVSEADVAFGARVCNARSTIGVDFDHGSVDSRGSEQAAQQCVADDELIAPQRPMDARQTRAFRRCHRRDLRGLPRGIERRLEAGQRNDRPAPAGFKQGLYHAR